MTGGVVNLAAQRKRKKGTEPEPRAAIVEVASQFAELSPETRMVGFCIVALMDDGSHSHAFRLDQCAIPPCAFPDVIASIVHNYTDDE